MSSFGSTLGELSPLCKPVVVAIDFGTAYSGIAFAYRADPLSIQFGAPTADDSQRKVPTALLSRDGAWEFGNVAEEKYNEILLSADSSEGALSVQFFKRFKMVLLNEVTGFDSLMAVSIAGKQVPLMELVVTTLVRLRDFAMEKVTLGYGGGLDPSRDVQWVLTVPAIWNDFGKAFMRRAAFAAGLMREEQSNTLMLVLEPEAAALAVHAAAVQHDLLTTDSRFLVLDCGGGTVDITAHEVTATQPLSMKSISAPTGGDWGGDYVNMEFTKFLKELLGPALFQPAEQPYEFYSIGVEFDRAKVCFDPLGDPALLRLVDVLDDKKQLVGLAEIYNAAHPDRPVLITRALQKGFLAMSKPLMLSFFEPFLQAIVEETRKVLLALPDIRSIVLVGGFGSSKVLIERVKAEFHGQSGVRILLPAKPQEAIVHGAVYCGLYQNLVVAETERQRQAEKAEKAGKAEKAEKQHQAERAEIQRLTEELARQRNAEQSREAERQREDHRQRLVEQSREEARQRERQAEQERRRYIDCPQGGQHYWRVVHNRDQFICDHCRNWADGEVLRKLNR